MATFEEAKAAACVLGEKIGSHPQYRGSGVGGQSGDFHVVLRLEKPAPDLVLPDDLGVQVVVQDVGDVSMERKV